MRGKSKELQAWQVYLFLGVILVSLVLGIAQKCSV